MEELRQRPDELARYEEMLRLKQALDAMPKADPPAGLAAAVMQAVRAIAGKGARRRSPSAVETAIASRPFLGVGLAFAAGLLVAFVVSGLANPGRVPAAADAAATALPKERIAAGGAARATLEWGGVRATAVAERVSGRVFLRLRVESGRALRLVASWNERGLRPLGFERGDAPADAVAVGPGSWRIDGAGEGEYVLVLDVREPAAHTVSLRLEQGQGAVEKTLEIAEG
jgi:hypothetical protein